MEDTDLLRGASLTSFSDAAVQAMGEQTGNVPERFTVESMSIERGGVVGAVQYEVVLRRE
jgi:hypothetical protein